MTEAPKKKYTNAYLSTLPIDVVRRKFEKDGYTIYGPSSVNDMANYIQQFDPKDRMMFKYITREYLVRNGGYLIQNNKEEYITLFSNGFRYSVQYKNILYIFHKKLGPKSVNAEREPLAQQLFSDEL